MSHWENISKTDQWYTPKYIFDAMGNPRFDLDVAAPMLFPAYINAQNWFWENALEQEWVGFVWMNPPYLGRNKIADWLDKFVEHGNGICLVPDRTSAPKEERDRRKTLASFHNKFDEIIEFLRGLEE